MCFAFCIHEEVYSRLQKETTVVSGKKRYLTPFLKLQDSLANALQGLASGRLGIPFQNKAFLSIGLGNNVKVDVSNSLNSERKREGEQNGCCPE